MDKHEFIMQSKIFDKVLKHRGQCKGWKNGNSCKECFGGGLSKFVDDLAKEGLIKRYDKLIKKWI